MKTLSSSMDSDEQKIDVRPPVVSIKGYAGDTLQILLSGEGASGSGTWVAQVRKSASDRTVVATFTTDSREDGLWLTLDAATTASMGGGWSGVWDAQLTSDDGVVRTAVRGTLTLTHDVSRP